jgi:hypothetical protein
MNRLFGAALVAALGAPALLSAQAAPAQQQPSPFAALERREELRLSAAQFSRITVARDSLREAHRIHCGPMHASTPTEAEEARHHAEMAAINERWEGVARAALTPEQVQRLAATQAASPAPAHGEGHGAGHGAHPAPATSAAPAAGHSGHHPRR